MKISVAAGLLACLVLGPPARSQDVESAKVFVQQVYGDYANRDTRHQEQRQAKFYTAELYRLILADRTGHPGDIGNLEGDPICDCQDPGRPGELKVQTVQIAATGSDRAKAQVAFVIGKQRRQATLSLRYAASGWKIDDISTKDMPSLRVLLGGKKEFRVSF